MTNPLVSVILPTRNRAAIVGAAIRSVLEQTYPRFELIVVDDASDDKTVEVVRALGDPRIRLLALDRQRGASGARNTGIEAAQGGWIAFQDSDDVWMPDKLRKQVDCAVALPPDYVAVYTSYWRIDGTARDVLPRTGPGMDGQVLPRLLRGNFITTQTLLVRTERARDIGGFDPDLSALNDWDYAIRLAQRGRIRWVAEPLVEYRLQEDSLSVSLDRFVDDYLHVMKKHRAQMCPDGAAEAWHWATIGSRLCRAGDRRRGRRFLSRAWHLQPSDLRYAGAWALSWLPSPWLRSLSRCSARFRT